MPKQIVPLILALFLFGPISKAQVNTDSLRSVWNDASRADSTRMDAVNKMAWLGFRLILPDSALFYSQKQLDFAKELKNKKYQVLALNTQADFFILKGQPDTALLILNRALEISKNQKDKKIELNTLSNFARCFKSKGDIDKSEEYQLEIAKSSEGLGYTEIYASTLLDLGIINVNKGNLTKGFESLLKGKKLFEELGDLQNLARARSFLASIYMAQNNQEEALVALNQNLAYFKKTGNKTLIGGTLSNLAGVYGSQGEIEKAMSLLEEALALFSLNNNLPYIANLSQNLGRLHFAQGNYKRALEYAEKGLKATEIIKNDQSTAYARWLISKVYYKLERYQESISEGKKSLLIFQSMEEVINIKENAQTLSLAYQASRDFENALKMSELYHAMRDTLNNQNNQKAIIELKVQTDYDKKKAIDDIENQKEIDIEEQKTKAQSMISMAIGIGLVLISILAFAIFNRLKVTNKQKLIIEEQKKKVEQSEKYKEQFLANMSHEIRTPMHAISGMIKILERNPHPEAQDVFLKAMETSSDNLVVILNDVLDLSKIEAGKLDIEVLPINPKLILENVIQILKFKAEEKALDLSYRIENNVPDLVLGDPTRLNQILLNLAGNAIKFTEKGKVELILKAQDHQLHFEISDTGIGISQEKQNTIFEAFEQGQTSTSRHYGGTGLGLNISRQLVELQNGKIGLKSIEGEGSSFFFQLPFGIPESSSLKQNIISKEELEKMADELKGIRILMAEDHPFNQMIAEDDLNYHIKDLNFVVVENGELAIDKFKNEIFDLILMDVQMPIIDGFGATKAIRTLEKEKGMKPIPIIAMTASLLKSEIDSCFKAGMNNYIPKPYKLEELLVPIYKELRS